MRAAPGRDDGTAAGRVFRVYWPQVAMVSERASGRDMASWAARAVRHRCGTAGGCDGVQRQWELCSQRRR